MVQMENEERLWGQSVRVSPSSTSVEKYWCYLLRRDSKIRRNLSWCLLQGFIVLVEITSLHLQLLNASEAFTVQSIPQEWPLAMNADTVLLPEWQVRVIFVMPAITVLLNLIPVGNKNVLPGTTVWAEVNHHHPATQVLSFLAKTTWINPNVSSVLLACFVIKVDWPRLLVFVTRNTTVQLVKCRLVLLNIFVRLVTTARYNVWYFRVNFIKYQGRLYGRK